MRTISGTLLTAQTASTRTPFIKMLFTSKDGLTTRDLSTNSAAYGNRILSLDHVEEAYNDYATVLLRNSDKGVPNVLGYWTQIGYGDGSEYAGDGVNGGSRACSRLWVKSQQTISAGGRLYTILELEGMWARLREVLVLLGTAPYYSSTYSSQHVYDILEALIETEMGWTLDALGAQDDSIIDTLAVDFDINQSGNIYEYMAGVIYRLLRNTKCHLRAKASNAFEVRYPQAADTVDLRIYSFSGTITDQSHTTPVSQWRTLAGATWAAMSFTTTVVHQVTAIKLKMRRVGSPGTLTVSIRAASGGVPTGSDLVSGTYNGDAITTDVAGEEITVSLGAGYPLATATQYVIVIRAPSGDGSNYLGFAESWNGTDNYTGGGESYSLNSGVDWTAFSTYLDAYFVELQYGPTAFYEYTNRNIVHIPNRIYVYANQDADGRWTAIVNGDESDSGSVDAYAEIASIFLAPSIATAGNADLLAAAVLSKIKAESVVGIGLTPHHCAIEILDRIQFIDTRGGSSNTYPSDGTVRVGGLRHIYKPGYYRLQITLGGVTVGGEMARAAGQTIVFTESDIDLIKASRVPSIRFEEPEKPPWAAQPAPPLTPRRQITLKPTQGVWREERETIRPATEEERQYYAVQGFLRRIGRWLWGSRE